MNARNTDLNSIFSTYLKIFSAKFKRDIYGKDIVVNLVPALVNLFLIKTHLNPHKMK